MSSSAASDVLPGLQSVAPAERKADRKFRCKLRRNPTLDVASVKLKVF